MSLKDCLDNAVAGEQISKEEADDLVKRHRQLQLELGDAGAAKLRLAEDLEREAIQRKRAALLTRQAQARIAGEIYNHKNGRGEFDPAAYLTAVLEHFGIDAGTVRRSVEGRRKAIVGMAHAGMEQLLFEFRRSAVLARRMNPARLENVVRELFGTGTGDAAAQGFAQAWSRIAEDLRQRFNAAGGAIGHLQNWGLPQAHDMRALRNAGFTQWRAYIIDRLDPARMMHPLYGRPMTHGEVLVSLQRVWDSVLMDNWNTRQPSTQPVGRGALYLQHADHRFLVFRDADAWLEYSREFGRGGDAFEIMMSHINTMARDIAAMEVLGPNPDATLRWMQQIVEQEAARRNAGHAARFPLRSPGTGLEINAPDYAAGAIKRSNEMWAYMRGASTTPVLTIAAQVVETMRNVNIAAKLGSAAVSALTDPGFQAMARRFAGLPAVSVVRDVVAQFGRNSRREAVRAGLILDSAMHGLGQHARYVGTLAGAEWSRYLADRVLAITGLSPMTQAGRHAFGMSFFAEAADRVQLDFASLPPAFRDTFTRYGIDAADWNRIRTAQLYQPHPGATFLRPQEIAAVDRDLAERFLEMVLSETEYAVPSSSVRASTALVTDRPGTFWGSISRSFAQFKTFGILAVMLHGGRIFRDLTGGRPARGAAYAGGLVVLTTLLGGLSMQLKQISQGKDPRPMDEPKFWGSAILQGGGMGIFGDFLFADVSRNGKGWSDIIAGPVVGMVDDIRRVALRTPMNAIEGEKTNLGRDLVNLARSYTPGGSIWYTRLMWERLVLDQLQYLVDPEAREAFRRKQQHAQRNYQQSYWWRPGETQARRAVDLTAAAGR